MTKMINVNISVGNIDPKVGEEWANEIVNVYADMEVSNVSASSNSISFQAGLSGMDDTTAEDIKMKENNENSVNEIRIEINDSSSSHNNNFAITLKSKNVDVDKMLPMAKQWVMEHKQKAWQGV